MRIVDKLLGKEVQMTPRDCIAIQRCRRINYAYAAIEKLSLVYGTADPETFCFYIPTLRQLWMFG